MSIRQNTVIVGAGPYGLSLAAHLAAARIPFRIFGRPMDFWLNQMPKGMLLKSEGFASNISDPADRFLLSRFCAERNIAYADMGVPVALETFIEYGHTFAEKYIPHIETKLIASVERLNGLFCVVADDGEQIETRNVVIATGIAPFAFVPPVLERLGPALATHSSWHNDLSVFAGRRVAVLGSGASALDTALLLYNHKASVKVISRHDFFRFNERAPVKSFSPSWSTQIRHPLGGIGPGWRNKIFGDAPWAVWFLPPLLRGEIYRRSHGPSGGWYCKEPIESKIDVLAGYALREASQDGQQAKIFVKKSQESKGTDERELVVDHVISATGFRLDVDKLRFLDRKLILRLKLFEHSPSLGMSFQSSVPGLYFIGAMAAPSFGPVLRFAYGARFAARRVAASLRRSAVGSE